MLKSGLGDGGGVCSFRNELPCDFFCRLLGCDSTDSEEECDFEEAGVDESLLFEVEAEEAAAAAAAAAARAAWVTGM